MPRPGHLINSAFMKKPATARGDAPVKQGLSQGGTTKPEGQWHHGDLRASLIAWGTHLLDTEGIAGMSMRTAAKLAGVSPGAPAYHFKDRNGLLAAIAAQGFRDLVAYRRQSVESIDPADAQGRLRAIMLAYVAFAQAHPARFHLMFGPEIADREQYPELAEAGAASFQVLRSAIGPVLQAPGVGELTEEQLAFSVWAATHGLATLTIDRRRLPVASTHKPTAEQMADVVVQFCLAALRGSAAPR